MWAEKNREKGSNTNLLFRKICLWLLAENGNNRNIGGLLGAHLVPSVHKCAHCTLAPSVHRPSNILCPLGQATIERWAHWILQCAHSVLEVCIAVCTGCIATMHT